MKGRITFGLLVAAVVAFACAPRQGSGDVGADTHLARAKPAAHGAAALAATLAVVVKNGVKMDFHVVNASAKRLEVDFPSGQTHEVVVLDSLGRVVWRWSAGRIFTQSLQNKVLHSTDSMNFNAEWHNAPAGTYTAVATLASQNFPVEQRAEFVVR